MEQEPVTGGRVSFTFPEIDKSHIAWSHIKHDSYLLMIRFKYQHFQIYPDDQECRRYHRLPIRYSNTFHSITPSQARTPRRIRRFLVNTFKNLWNFEEEFRETDIMNEIHEFLQRFVLRNPPGTTKIAMLSILMCRIDDFSFSPDETDDKIYDREIGQYLLDPDDYLKQVVFMVGMGDGICSICLDEFKDREDDVVRTDCSHYFHEKCIDVWLIRDTTCPMCRRKIRCIRQQRKQ